MSTHRYPGGVISATPPTASASSAVGVWTLEEALRNKAAGNWPDGSGLDPYFDYTTLLLHGDGTNGAQNNTFLDSSTNNFTITRNGNTTQGSFGPYAGPGCWSDYYGTTTSTGWQTPANSGSSIIGSAFNATATFTVEAWIYPLARHSGGGAAQAFVFGAMQLAGSSIDWCFGPDSNGNLVLVWYAAGNQISKSTSLIPLNTWTHIALCVNNGAIKMFINGVQETLTGLTSTTTSSTTTSYCSSGGYLYAGTTWQGFNGHISNLRVIARRAAYTANFTPSTTPLVATSDTTLLTCQQNGFVDSSGAGWALTTTGGAQISKFSPFTLYQVTPTSYSGYFDGTGDYLTAPASNSTIWPGSGSFTIEYWLYLPANPSTGYYTHFSYGTSGSVLRVFNAAATSKIEVFSGTSTILNPAWPTAGQWNHFALVRNGTTLTLYINGAVAQSVTNSTDFSTGTLTIGGESASNPLLGSISNFRIVKGTAVYTSAFTPPTSPLTAISGTSLLTCQSTTFIDNSTNAFTITVNGNATPERANPFTDTVTGPTAYATTTYGGSAYFDGTGDYLGVASNAAFAFGTGDFTIECWFLTTSSGVYQRFWWFGDDNDNTNISTGNAVQFGGASQTAITGSTIYTNNWYHLAYVRSSGSGKLYLNGAQVGSTTANSYNSSARTFYIGATGAGANPFFGYISNLRIVKGTAVYNGPFVPPTSPVTAVTNTQLLLNATNAGIFDNTTVNNLETVGAAQISTSVVKYGTGSMYFNGGTSYLNIPNSNAIMFGTGDFTIEGWFYNSASQVSNSGIFSYYVSGYFILHNNASAYPNLLTVYVDNYGAGTRVLTGTTTLALNTWYYFAITRSSGVWRLFLNGTQEGSSYTNSAEPVPASAPLRIGYGNTAGYTGYIDDFRITKGYARYTANFTPPAAAFPNF